MNRCLLFSACLCDVGPDDVPVCVMLDLMGCAFLGLGGVVLLDLSMCLDCFIVICCWTSICCWI